LPEVSIARMSMKIIAKIASIAKIVD